MAEFVCPTHLAIKNNLSAQIACLTKITNGTVTSQKL